MGTGKNGKETSPNHHVSNILKDESMKIERRRKPQKISLTFTVKRNETTSFYLFLSKTMRLVKEEVFDSKLTV